MGAVEARVFAKEGAAVVVCDLHQDEGEAIASEIRAAGGDAVFHQMDVAQDADWDRVLAAVSARFGKLDILVNNAGITHRAGILGTARGEWDRVLAVNLSAIYVGIQKCAPLMRAGGGGAIVNIGSVAGLSGYHSASYAASKWGALGLTKSAAIELVDWNIRVNAVLPGIVETPLALNASKNFDLVKNLTPQQRAGRPEEVAQAVLFLASDKASYITGESIAIDGGLMAGALFWHIGRENGDLYRNRPD